MLHLRSIKILFIMNHDTLKKVSLFICILSINFFFKKEKQKLVSAKKKSQL